MIFCLSSSCWRKSISFCNVNWNFFKRCHLAGSLLVADRGNKQLHRFLQGVAFLHPLHEELVYPVYLADSLVKRRIRAVLVGSDGYQVCVVVVE